MATTRTRINIHGIERLGRAIEQLKPAIFSALSEAAKEGADIVRDEAKNRARRKSGELADGIISKVTWDKRAPIVWVGAGMDKAKNNIFVKFSADGKRYYYPSSIEYGHAGAPAYPFMRPSMDAKKSAIRKVIRDKIKRVIDSVRP
jgi:HK97 gp10 family phage protein